MERKCFGFVLTVLPALSMAQPPPVISDAEASAAGLTRLWECELPLDHGEAIRSVYVVDDHLYVLSEDGNLYSLDRHQGLIRWVRGVTRPGYPIQAPKHLGDTDGSLFTSIVGRNHVTLLDAYDGSVAAKLELDFTATTPAVGNATRLILGGTDARVHTLAWRNAPLGAPMELWDALAGGPVTVAAVMLDPELVLFASQSGQISVSTLSTPQRIWIRQLHTPVLQDVTLADDGVYVAGEDGSVYRLATPSGSLVQRYRLPSPAADAPWMDATLLYVLGRDRQVYASDIVSGKLRWQFGPAAQLVARHDANLVVETQDRRLAFLDLETGKENGSLEIYRANLTASNRLDDGIYLLSDRGLILCLRPEGASRMLPRQLGQAAALRHGGDRAADPEDAAATDTTEKTPEDEDVLRSRNTLPPIAGNP